MNRDALFSYHKASERFLSKIMSIFVSAHYKNNPNDLQMLSDAPAQQLFVLMSPVSDNETEIPDVSRSNLWIMLCLDPCRAPRRAGRRAHRQDAAPRDIQRPSGGRRPDPLDALSVLLGRCNRLNLENMNNF